MPKVGRKKFPYTPSGKARAKAYARKMGKPVRSGYGSGLESRGGSRMSRGSGLDVSRFRGQRRVPTPFRQRRQESNTMNDQDISLPGQRTSYNAPPSIGGPRVEQDNPWDSAYSRFFGRDRYNRMKEMGLTKMLPRNRRRGKKRWPW